MIATRPISRIAYAETKVRRFADDVAAARTDADPAWADLALDADRFGSDLSAMRTELVRQYESGTLTDDFRAGDRFDRIAATWATAVGALPADVTRAQFLQLANEWESATVFETVFRQLTATWKADTRYFSSSTAMDAHPAFQRIQRLGDRAVPFILNDLRDTSAHWFTALEVLTRATPVPPADRGNIPRMAAAWLAWGRAAGRVA